MVFFCNLTKIDTDENKAIYSTLIILQAEETNTLIFTILDVQPRLSSGGTGKSNDEIVYELADSILEKLMDKLDIEVNWASLDIPSLK